MLLLRSTHLANQGSETKVGQVLTGYDNISRVWNDRKIVCSCAQFLFTDILRLTATLTEKSLPWEGERRIR